MKITKRRLKALGACNEFLDKFYVTFGSEAAITASNIMKAEERGLPVKWLWTRLRTQLGSLAPKHSNPMERCVGCDADRDPGGSLLKLARAYDRKQKAKVKK